MMYNCITEQLVKWLEGYKILLCWVSLPFMSLGGSIISLLPIRMDWQLYVESSLWTCAIFQLTGMLTFVVVDPMLLYVFIQPNVGFLLHVIFIALEPTLGSYYNINFLWWTQHWGYILFLCWTQCWVIVYIIFCGGPNVGLHFIFCDIGFLIQCFIFMW